MGRDSASGRLHCLGRPRRADGVEVRAVLTCITIMVPSCDGPAVQIIEVAICRARTRRYPPNRVVHILDEMRISAVQVNR